MALSSSLVAIGFVAGSTDLLIPFAAIVLPVVFLLGVFTVVRLVDTALDGTYCLQGIARIRGYYRTLGPGVDVAVLRISTLAYGRVRRPNPATCSEVVAACRAWCALTARC